MGLANTATHYGSITKAFHWLTALLILTVIPLGLIAKDMALVVLDPQATPDPDTIARAALLFSLHKTVGVAIFFTALARIIWAMFHPAPGPIAPDRRAQVLLARTVHRLLYGSLLLVPLTGWATHAAAPGFAPILWPFGQSLPLLQPSPRLADIFAGLHVTFERVLVFAIILHVTGALKHHFLDRDATLLRMWPGRRTGPATPSTPHGFAPPLAALAVWLVALTIGGSLGLFETRQTAPNRPPSRSETASQWQVLDGTLGLTITQLGSSVAGTFQSWAADITFDETVKAGPAGHVSVTVATDSVTLGPVSGQAKGPDFLDTQRFPTATFEGEITAGEAGLTAEGPLVLRDVSVPISLPFTLTFDADNVTMSGSTTLHRLDYGIGATLPDEASLGIEVLITVNLTAQRTVTND